MRDTQYFRRRDVICFSDAQLDQLEASLPELTYQKVIGTNGFPNEISLIEATHERKRIFKFISIGTDLETNLTSFHYKKSDLTREQLAPYLARLPVDLSSAIASEIESKRADLLVGFDATISKPTSWVDGEIARLRARRAASITSAASATV